jgi:hypothetical protein
MMRRKIDGGDGGVGLEFSVCGLAQCSEEQALIAEAMAQFMLEAADGVQVLRSTRVLVGG